MFVREGVSNPDVIIGTEVPLLAIRHTSLLPRISSSLAQMVRRCIAAGCNSTTKDDVTLYFFPKDVGLRQK